MEIHPLLKESVSLARFQLEAGESVSPNVSIYLKDSLVLKAWLQGDARSVAAVLSSIAPAFDFDVVAHVSDIYISSPFSSPTQIFKVLKEGSLADWYRAGNKDNLVSDCVMYSVFFKNGGSQSYYQHYSKDENTIEWKEEHESTCLPDGSPEHELSGDLPSAIQSALTYSDTMTNELRENPQEGASIEGVRGVCLCVPIAAGFVRSYTYGPGYEHLEQATAERLESPMASIVAEMFKRRFQ